MKTFFFYLLTLSSVLFAKYDEVSLLDGWQEDNSVLKIWFTVLGLLDEVDRGSSSGFAIRFAQEGKYYDVLKGDNWWTYYFAFDSVGDITSKTIHRIPRYQRSMIRFQTACTMPEERGHELLSKYMKLKPEILERLELLKKEVRLGVYYQPITSSEDLEALYRLIAEEKEKIGVERIYLVTEVEALKERFRKECICLTGIQGGDEELLAMYLFAGCDTLIASGSYYSIGAKFLNPQLNVMELSPFPYLCK